LAHGFGCDQNLWRLVEARLASSFRLILFDHVGCGASDPSAWDPQRYESLQGYADDILGIVRELDLRNLIFVGHSVAAMMGGWSCLLPHRVTSTTTTTVVASLAVTSMSFWTRWRATTLGGRDRWRR
jgi:pimeloyl-ACP methyl ester carboxylesterase